MGLSPLMPPNEHASQKCNDNMIREGFDTAQICLNGHVITASAASFPEFTQNFCDRCGAATITTCQSCGAQIRGRYHSPGPLSFAAFDAPRHCHNCGSPYLWTTSAIEAAQKLADELDNLTEEEQEQLKSAIPALVRETPQTQVATLRFKRIMAKAGGAAAEGIRSVLIDIVSEGVRKAIWGA